jgi:hypothetical protein
MHGCRYQAGISSPVSSSGEIEKRSLGASVGAFQVFRNSKVGRNDFPTHTTRYVSLGWALSGLKAKLPVTFTLDSALNS